MYLQVFETIEPVVKKHPEYVEILERLVEPVSSSWDILSLALLLCPAASHLNFTLRKLALTCCYVLQERQIMFRIAWTTDKGDFQLTARLA